MHDSSRHMDTRYRSSMRQIGGDHMPVTYEGDTVSIAKEEKMNNGLDILLENRDIR